MEEDYQLAKQISDSIAKLTEGVRQLETPCDAWRLEAGKARQTIAALEGLLESIHEVNAEWQREYEEKGV